MFLVSTTTTVVAAATRSLSLTPHVVTAASRSVTTARSAAAAAAAGWSKRTTATSLSSILLSSSLRGGGGGETGDSGTTNSTTTSNASRNFAASNSTTTTTTQYQTLCDPAPGSPFHYAFPVHDLDKAKEFYGTVLGCQEGRSSEKWQDYSLCGHQIVAHWVGPNYKCQDYYNPVDGDEVPVPHMGLALTVEQFHELAARLKDHGVKFIIEPTLRFEGQPGEQYTMFFKDPSGNNLEFKAMTHPENLFAKYNVPPV